MKKRRELDALVNGKIGRRKQGHELLRNDTDSSGSEEVEEFSVPVNSATRKLPGRLCATCLAVTGFVLLVACMVTVGGLVWVHFNLRTDISQLRQQLHKAFEGQTIKAQAHKTHLGHLIGLSCAMKPSVKNWKQAVDIVDVQGQGDTNTADFSTLETRQNDLQKVVGQLSVDGVQKLRENVTLIRKQLKELSSAVSDLQKSVVAAATLTALPHTVTDLTKAVAKIGSDIASLQQSMSSSDKVSSSISTRIDTLQSQIETTTPSMKTDSPTEPGQSEKEQLRRLANTTSSLSARVGLLELRSLPGSASTTPRDMSDAVKAAVASLKEQFKNETLLRRNSLEPISASVHNISVAMATLQTQFLAESGQNIELSMNTSRDLTSLTSTFRSYVQTNDDSVDRVKERLQRLETSPAAGVAESKVIPDYMTIAAATTPSTTTPTTPLASTQPATTLKAMTSGVDRLADRAPPPAAGPVARGRPAASGRRDQAGAPAAARSGQDDRRQDNRGENSAGGLSDQTEKVDSRNRGQANQDDKLVTGPPGQATDVADKNYRQDDRGQKLDRGPPGQTENAADQSRVQDNQNEKFANEPPGQATNIVDQNRGRDQKLDSGRPSQAENVVGESRGEDRRDEKLASGEHSRVYLKAEEGRPNGERTMAAEQPTQTGEGVQKAEQPSVSGEGIQKAEQPTWTGEGVQKAEQPTRTGEGVQKAEQPAQTGESVQKTDQPARTEEGVQQPARTGEGDQKAVQPAQTGESVQKTDQPARTEEGVQQPARTGEGDQKAEQPARTGEDVQMAVQPAWTGEGVQKAEQPARTGEGVQKAEQPARTGEGDQKAEQPARTGEDVQMAVQPAWTGEGVQKAEKPTQTGEGVQKAEQPTRTGEGVKQADQSLETKEPAAPDADASSPADVGPPTYIHSTKITTIADLEKAFKRWDADSHGFILPHALPFFLGHDLDGVDIKRFDADRNAQYSLEELKHAYGFYRGTDDVTVPTAVV